MGDVRSELMQEALRRGLDDNEILSFADYSDTKNLMHLAAKIRDQGHQNTISYSRKVFIPLTHLCRDVSLLPLHKYPEKCGTYLTPEEVLKIADEGAKADVKRHFHVGG